MPLPPQYNQGDAIRLRQTGLNGVLGNAQKKFFIERQQMVSAMTASVVSTASTVSIVTS